MRENPEERPAAILVAVQLPGVTDVDHEADLAELGRLAHTCGYDVVATVTQRRDALAAAAVLGEGKLKELAAMTGGEGVIPSGAPDRMTKARAKFESTTAKDALARAEEDAEDASKDEAPDVYRGKGHKGAPAPEVQFPKVIIVDHEISPSQARNLEKATGAEVHDRTGIIVEIFHRHAKSREARLQVEIARLVYVAPRLREGAGGGDRVRGGVGGKGAGESALELDRRKIRDRIAELREELEAIQRDQATRRALRRDQRRVALVGYTNAGKSSLMRALTGSDVLVADKLFATLDTTVRALHPETKPRVLVSDTVGFIKKLPHDLVASFRSTLDEALEASLLLYVADASDPTFRAQLEVTQSVLREIGANAVPSKLLLNKVDRLDEHERLLLSREYPEAIQLSAREAGDVAQLRETIVAYFDSEMVEGELTVPYAKQALVGQVHESAKVVSEEYDEVGARLTIKAHPVTLARLQSLISGS